MSRYYDPVTHRFVNADIDNIRGVGSATIENTNLFLYCDNNPLSRSDEYGDFWNIIGGAVFGSLIGAGVEIAGQIISGKGINELDWGYISIEVLSEMTSGVLALCGVPPVTSIAIDCAIASAASILHSVKDGDYFATAQKMLFGMVSRLRHCRQ